MNIAFYTYYECCPSIGGTERTTSLVAKSLKDFYAYKIFSIYKKSVNKDIERFQFEESFHYISDNESSDGLLSYIRKNNISVIINQGDFKFGLSLSMLLKNNHVNCSHIFALHFAPGSFEEAHISLKNRINRWKQTHSFVEGLKIIMFPIYHRILQNNYRSLYKKISLEADKIVLLSNNYIQDWIHYAGIETAKDMKNHIMTIPNGLAFNYYATESDILAKDYKVLIVARLDENQKKLTTAFNIWKEVSSMSGLESWELDVVGDGPDSQFYRKYIHDNKIPRVNFYGRQDPQLYYKRASIFLMTSEFEGFGMTLIEASQFGAVPIVFNTFGATTDIIENGKNGFIIDVNNNKDYEDKLNLLIQNSRVRFNMAKDAVENARRYSLNTIAEKWQNLITPLYKVSKSNYTGAKDIQSD